MPKIYKQLSIEERETIQIEIWQKKSIRSIAKELGRTPQTKLKTLAKANVFNLLGVMDEVRTIFMLYC